MGRKIERGEKRRKSHSRSIRNKKYKEIPIILFFFLWGWRGKNTEAGGGPKKRKL